MRGGGSHDEENDENDDAPVIPVLLPVLLQVEAAPPPSLSLTDPDATHRNALDKRQHKYQRRMTHLSSEKAPSHHRRFLSRKHQLQRQQQYREPARDKRRRRVHVALAWFALGLALGPHMVNLIVSWMPSPPPHPSLSPAWEMAGAGAARVPLRLVVVGHWKALRGTGPTSTPSPPPLGFLGLRRNATEESGGGGGVIASGGSRALLGEVRQFRKRAWKGFQLSCRWGEFGFVAELSDAELSRIVWFSSNPHRPHRASLVARAPGAAATVENWHRLCSRAS